ncbi:MAG: gliding motility protein GldN [Bacteroidales bacterium]|nr:gliding motility protein GldN [Bacteroidales bacterium]
MKKLLFCLGLFLFMAGGFTANAQSIIDAEEDHNFNDFYKRDQAKGRDAMPYAFLREADVVWEHAIWRKIDFREKFNQFFYFPTDPSKNTQNRVSLTTAILDALKNGDIEAYKEDDLKTPTTFQEIMAPICRESVMHISEYDEYGDEMEGRDTVIKTEFQNEEVYSARIKEYWYIDKQDTRQKVRITALALVYNDCKFRDGERTCQDVDLFWIPMDDMRVRNALVKVLAYDERNSHAERTYDDIFIQRYFDSFCYRQSNVMNRPISAYLTGTDAILESQAIESEIFNIESDMWEY